MYYADPVFGIYGIGTAARLLRGAMPYRHANVPIAKIYRKGRSAFAA